ncbi:MAG: hypothetical protein NT086_08960 [Proteobacteria bacterium]|nr:hypothetical protein [Pseudomonadota bacterium]
MEDLIMGFEQHEAALMGLARLLRESLCLDRPADIAALLDSLARDHAVQVQELKLALEVNPEF